MHIAHLVHVFALNLKYYSQNLPWLLVVFLNVYAIIWGVEKMHFYFYHLPLITLKLKLYKFYGTVKALCLKFVRNILNTVIHIY